MTTRNKILYLFEYSLYGYYILSCLFKARKSLPLSFCFNRIYLIKAINLSVCYGDIVFMANGVNRRRTAESGMLSSYYDYVTDHLKEQVSFISLRSALDALDVRGNVIEVVKTMFEKDVSCDFTHDGLERGVLSLKAILLHHGISIDEKSGIIELGLILQMIDDALDLQDDLLNEHLNCFSDGKKGYALKYSRYDGNHMISKMPLITHLYRVGLTNLINVGLLNHELQSDE